MPNPDLPASERHLTITEFCRIKHISRATYFKLQRAGLGPQTISYGAAVRISPAAVAAWDQVMVARAQQEAARAEQSRRRDLATQAGRAAAQSPNHISHQRKRARAD